MVVTNLTFMKDLIMRILMLLMIAMFLSGITHAQEIDVANDLNAKLISATPLSYGELKNKEVKVCKIVMRDVTVGGPISGLKVEMPEEVCQTSNKVVDTRYRAPGKVKSTEIIEVQDFKFHEDRLVELPESIVVKEVPIYYCIVGSFDNSIGESINVTRGHSFNKNKSVATTTSLSVTAGNTATTGVSATAGYQRTLTVGSNEGNTKSESVTKNMTNIVRFTGPQAVNVKIFAYESTLDIPYSGSVIVDADLIENNSGVMKASQILSLEDRTFPISGKLRVDEVSNVEYRVFSIPDGCVDPELQGSKIVEVKPQYRTAVKLTPELERLRDNQGSNSQPSQTNVSDIPNSASKSTSGNLSNKTASIIAQVISPADGVSYTVISSHAIQKSDPSCGYSQFGFAKPRNFLVEKREYKEASNGTIVRTWTETTETPGQCA